MFDSNYGMYSGYEVEKETKKECSEKNMNPCMNCCMMGVVPICGAVCSPVFECPKERQIHRQIIHEVPQEL